MTESREQREQKEARDRFPSEHKGGTLWMVRGSDDSRKEAGRCTRMPQRDQKARVLGDVRRRPRAIYPPALPARRAAEPGELELKVSPLS